MSADDEHASQGPSARLRHIGDVADLTGLSHRTIRYYEEMGLVHPADRTEGGFRLYDEAGVERLRLITPMKPLGYSIDEIRDLLRALDTLGDPAADEEARHVARALVQRSWSETQERIAELRVQISRAESFSAMLGGLAQDG